MQKEVKDRQDFLKEMEAIGKGEQYRTIIATEISQVSLKRESHMLRERTESQVLHER